MLFDSEGEKTSWEEHLKDTNHMVKVSMQVFIILIVVIVMSMVVVIITVIITIYYFLC